MSADCGPVKFNTRYYEKKEAAFVNASMQNESAVIPSLGTDDAVGGDASTSISKSTRKLANRLIAEANGKNRLIAKANGKNRLITNANG